ncbi:MAG TPA: GNAT family N-acetyltransferase [Candidatus Saccharimonadales bacterium]|nr:GNAT family N-acetyltransferase [Candidatus Saccharimonadales bacterium]
MDPYFRRYQLEVADPLTQQAARLVFRDIYDESVPEIDAALKTLEWGEPKVFAITDGSDGQQLLAYGSLRDPGRSREARIDELVVAPSCRGIGLGRIMLLGLEAEAKRGAFEYVSLEATLKSAAFYEKYGYEQHPRARKDLRKSL